jgi:hypothetical protein
MAEYVQYVTGVENSTNQSYDFLVSGRDDYGSSGVMIKGDTSSQPGLAIIMDASNNTRIDHRASASNSISVRIIDNDTQTIHPLMVVKKDAKTDPNVNAVEIGGRIKASQFHVDEPDTRAPVNEGVYLSVDNVYTARIRNNKGDGTGGFVFTTHNPDGTIDKLNMALNANGTILLPQYQRTEDSYDDENYAIATFDAQGKLQRSYQQNRRFQSIESRTTATEGDKTDAAVRINEIIRRMNSLSIFSTDMSELVLTPGFTFPQAGLYVQNTGMTSIDGSFNAYVVYPDYRAYTLNTDTMMVSGDPLMVPFDTLGWSRVGDHMENDKFSIAYYYNLSQTTQQALRAASEKAKRVENFSSLVQYKGMAPWASSKWMSVIEVR